MKIILIGSGYDYEFPHPACGGSEGCTERLAIGLNKENIECIVICAKRSENKDYPFKVLDTKSLPEKYHIGSNFQEEAIDIAIQQNPDLIITQNFHWKLNQTKCPVFINVHGGGDGKLGESNDRNDNIYYKFISKTQMDRCIDQRPEFGKNSFLCYTSLLDEDFIFEPKGEYFLWCASLCWGYEAKGLDLFIQLASLYPEHKFIAHGMGNQELENFLKNTIEPNLQNFKFNGYLDRYKNHNEVFSKAIAFCQLSRLHESFGRTTVEALSKGVPVIHLGTGATPELVRENGIMAENQKDLVSSIKKSFEFDRKKIFDDSKRFHISKEIETIINFYNSIKK